MEQPNHIDQAFQNRLYNAEQEPPAFVWDNLEATLRRKRRRLLFWWFVGSGLMLGGILYGLNHTSQPDTLAQNSLEPPIAQQSNDVDQSITGVSSDMSSTIPDPDRSLNQNGITNDLSKNTQPEAAVQTLTYAPDNTANLETNPTGLDKSGIQEGIKSAAVLPEVQKTESEALQQVASFDQLKSKLNPVNILEGKEDQKLPHVKIIRPRKKKEKNACYDFEEHPNVWFVDAYAGPMLPVRTLSTSNSEDLNYMGLRESTEKTGLGFNAGFRASMLINRHFLLRSGLHYEQHTEVFEYADPNFVEYTVKVRSELINGTWVTITDTIGVEYGENYQKTYNRFGRLDIPLLAGIEWRSGQTGISAQAGGSLNLLFWKRGTILNPQGEPQVFTPSGTFAQDVFKPRVGASLQGSVQWFYHIKPRLRVYAEPYFRYSLSPFSLNSHPIKTEYSFVGIQLGLTKILD
jgi:hypothetical protein